MPEAPRSTEFTPSPASEFLREWGEFATDGTAVDEGIYVRSCMSDNVLATVGWATFLQPAFRPSLIRTC